MTRGIPDSKKQHKSQVEEDLKDAALPQENEAEVQDENSPEPDTAPPTKSPALMLDRGRSDTRDMQTEKESADYAEFLQYKKNKSLQSARQQEADSLIELNAVQNDEAGRALADELKFMEDVLEVEVAESEDPGAEAVVQVGVNGVNQFFPRGQIVSAKRKYVEVLARAKPQTVSMQDTSQQDPFGEHLKPRRRSSLKYPFQVISDPAGKKGMEWLKKILGQA